MGGLLSWMLFFLVMISRLKGHCMIKRQPEYPGEHYVEDQCHNKSTPRCGFKCKHLVSNLSHSLEEEHIVCDKTSFQCAERRVKGYEDGDMCKLERCPDYARSSCLHGIFCLCEGNDCTALASLHYIAARLHGSILQSVDFAIYRYSMYDNFTDENLSPETFAISRVNASRSSLFNPRITVDRHLFTHLRQMILILGCFGIGSAFVYHPVNSFIEKHIKRKPRRRVRKEGKRSRSHSSPSRSNGMSDKEDDKVEEYLKDEYLLYNWSRPQQMLTPIECYPTLFSFDSAPVATILDRPVRCNQSKDYLVLSA